MSSPAAPPPRGWRSIRFTTRELMLLVVGLAIGMAYARVDGSEAWPDFWLACFGGCLVVGQVQKSWRIWKQRGKAFGTSVIDVLSPLAIAALMVFSGVMHAAERHTWWPYELYGRVTVNWFTEDLSDISFYLAVFCAYFVPVARPAKQGWRGSIARIVDGCVWILAVCWLWAVLEDGILLTALVHIAMRGVELAQPTRLAGQPFYPANVHTQLMQEFELRGYLTAGLLAAAAAANIALARNWTRSFRQRGLWAVSCGVLLVVAAWQVWWCLQVGFPTLSPFYYSVLDTMPPGNLAIIVVVVLTGSAAFAIRSCAEPHSTVLDGQRSDVISTGPCLHEWIFVPLCFLLAALWNGVWTIQRSYGMFSSPATILSNWWQAALLLFQVATSDPRWMFWLAALIVAGQCIWRNVRPKAGQSAFQQTVPPAKFAVVWPLALLGGLLLIPSAPWLAFALYMRWRGP